MEFFETYQGQLEILMIVGFAMFLGGVVGLEREYAGKPAGLRTHMLVAGSAALFVALGTVIVDDFLEQMDSSLARTDPIRILEAIVSGISFLGAGTILRDQSEGHVEGLTTAASILFAAGLGATVAVHQYILATGLVVLILFILRGLGIIERRLKIGPDHNGDKNQPKGQQ